MLCLKETTCLQLCASKYYREESVLSQAWQITHLHSFLDVQGKEKAEAAKDDVVPHRLKKKPPIKPLCMEMQFFFLKKGPEHWYTHKLKCMQILSIIRVYNMTLSRWEVLSSPHSLTWTPHVDLVYPLPQAKLRRV